MFKSRALRREYLKASYHIINRGIDRRNIFNQEDSEHRVKLLKQGTDSYRVEVIAYCLTSNHFHFIY
ncbi:MAG: transposase [Candidatus Omnitrophica bacterium]|nr:transposase [Candidatus Omnitrophota bacterium]